MVSAATGLQFASVGGENVFYPLALAAISQRDRKAIGRAKDIHWSVIGLARFSPPVSNNSEEGQPSCELAGDAVGDCEIEARQGFLAEAHHQHAR